MKAKKDEEIKARIDGHTKAALWQIAIANGLDMSDIVRQAIREFLVKQQQHGSATVVL